MKIGVFSLIPWSFLDQRPQVMAQKLQEWGHEVVYVEPLAFVTCTDDYPHPWEKYADDAWKIRKTAEGITLIAPVLIPLQHRFRRILHRNQDFREVNQTKLKEMGFDLAIVIDPQWGKILHEANIPFIYDHVDDTHHMEVCMREEFYAETIFCEKNSLFNIYIQPNIARRYNGLYIPNGINCSELVTLPQSEKIFDAVCLSCFSDWFDVESIFESKKKILLIGPMDDFIREKYNEFRNLGNENILWIPRIPRKMASMWLNLAKVGLLPFRQDHGVVDYVMPLKIVEYFKIGIPCVSYINKGIMEEFGDHVYFYSPTGWLQYPKLDEAIEKAEQDRRRDERYLMSEKFEWDKVLSPLKDRLSTLKVR